MGLSEQFLMCIWPGLTHRLTGSSSVSVGRQHRPGNSMGQFGINHPLLKGKRSRLILWAWHSKAVGFGSGELSRHDNALDSTKRSQEYCPMRVATNLSSGALQ